jgi:hypothetical protein
MDIKTSLPAIIIAASIVIAAVIYACSVRYEPVTEPAHGDYGSSERYAFDRWSGDFKKK